MSGIYIGTGSSTATLLPVQAYHDEPFVIPVVSEDKTIFPNWDSACTYGYNLGVSDYRGRIANLHGIPFDNGLVKAVSVNSATSFACNGMNVCPDQTTSHLYHFYPAFVANNGHSAEQSAKQKIRGRLYDSFDNYMKVPSVTRNDSLWPSASGLASNSAMYCYQVNNTGRNMKILGGFLVARVVGSSLTVSGLSVDGVFNSTSSPTPCMIMENGRMILSSNVDTGHAQANLNYTTKIISVDGDQYYVFLIKESTFASGNLLMSAPRLSITSPTDECRIEIVQWGITLGV